MKEHHRNHVLRAAETEKKGRRVKNQPKEACKCYAPFVKLHYYDCPAVKKSCPVHGHPHYHERREEKPETEQNMIISFHPSTKTERLFQPVKKLLAQCNPETRVNLQYYSPKSTTSKESLKHQEVQTRSEDGRKSINNNVFVEKTKSFVADKTNKMKKLKQCFYSPCNSIAQKSRSQTSIKEKFHEIFQEDRKMAPDKPPDDIKYDPTWFSSRFDFKDWEKLSGGKTDSDFITVTQQAKNNLINHKIFEIKHRKGINDLPFVRLPKQSTQLVYSSIDVDRPLKETPGWGDPEDQKRTPRNGTPSRGDDPQEGKQKRDEELSSEDNSHTSSSSSVYFTPFIFVPAATESDSDGKGKPTGRAEKGVQVGEGERKPDSQTSSVACKEDDSRESKTKSVLLQTDLDRQSGDSGTQGWYLRSVDVAESFTTRGTQTDEGLYPSDKSVGDHRGSAEYSYEDFTLSRNGSEDSGKKDKQTWTSPTSYPIGGDVEPEGAKAVAAGRTVEVQTSSFRWGGSVANTVRCTSSTLDKMCQTEPLKMVEVSRLWSVSTRRSQMVTLKLSNKTTQTVFSRSESLEEVSEFIELDSSNVTYVVKPFGSQESDQAIDRFAKAWWGKSRSDSELLGNRKCGCPKPESVIPLPQGCTCQKSDATRESVTPTKQSRKSTVSYMPGSEKRSSKGRESFRGERREQEAPETPRKVDKGLGTDDGAQRLYRRADKALGTDSGMEIAPGTSRRATRVTPGESRNATRSPRSPRTPEPVKTERKEESPRTPLSDLSELTRIIQEFFEKTGMTSWRNCTCEVPGVPGSKAESGGATADARKPKKEVAGPPAASGRKVDSETMTDTPKKQPRGEIQEIQAASGAKGPTATDSRQPNRLYADYTRVKIRRSVLLDDNQSKTRFICSVCAREISTFSINAATNTESPLNSRKKDTPTSVGGETSEQIKVKTVRTVHSFDTPNRSVASAPTAGAKVYHGHSNEEESKTLREIPRNPYKSYIPTPKPGGGVGGNERMSRETQSPVPSKPDTGKQVLTTSFQRPPPVKRCVCEEVDVCTVDTCTNRDPTPVATTSSRAPPPKSDPQPTPAQPGVANCQSRTSRRSSARERSQRKNFEHLYPVFIKSHWPRELAWNAGEKSQGNIPETSKSSASQQKRSHEKDAEPADSPPAGKKIKAEMEKSSKQSFVLNEVSPSELRMGDGTLIPSKGGLFWIPSFSASHVSPPRKRTLSPSKSIKSEEKVREEGYGLSPEGFNPDGSPDLFSAKSCHLTPIALGCDGKGPFDKLFECRVCKSLTFMKSDAEEVLFHWPHGVVAYRPETPTGRSPTSGRPRGEDPPEAVRQNESSNLEKLLEECARFSERSESPSTGELLEEEVGEATEEEPEAGSRARDVPPSLDDLFYSNAAVSSKSFNTFWFDGYSKKK